MSLHGHLYRVTDAASAFKPIIGGYGEEPTTGFKPWAAVTVSADYILEKTIPPRPPTKPRFKGYPGGTATYHWDPEVVKYVMLNFSGSEGDDVRINFTLRISPDTSSDLSKYVDLTLNGWDIEVDFPDSLWISPLGLSWMLFYGVAAEQEPVNEGILTFIARVLAGEDSIITQAAAQLFLQTQVTVTFMNIAYPENAYSWGLADTNDQTVILRATPAIGFPILF